MKRLYKVALLMLALWLACALADGFRGMPFGSSKEYVKSHEKKGLTAEEDSVLGYVANVDGLGAQVLY